ncbi:MAG: class I adenylate cyclase [Pseudomonadota bacterium]
MDSSTNDIDINNFEAHWDKIGEDKQADFIKASEGLSVEFAIQPVLKGIDSYHACVNTQARKTLKVLQSKVHSQLKDPADQCQWLKGLKNSAIVCSRIFLRIKPGLSFEEQAFILITLLGFKGKGAHFAFKAVCTRRISLKDMEKILLTVPDSQRLEFVREYLQADPELRLKFGASFKHIVQSIKDKNAVINFYARLFDAEQDIDPFLYNLHPRLRHSDRVISGPVSSKSFEIKVTGLKALAMMVPKIPSDLLLDNLTMETHTQIRRTVYKIIENSSLGTYSQIFHPILKLLEKSDDDEAFHAFKALIVSGKLPLTEVLEIVREKHPNLMEHICREISNLSKISFFFIQDIALNKDAYTESNIEINLAAAYGIIKKRPERIVSILKDHLKNSSNHTKESAALFIKKTKQLLAKESQNIEKEFDVIIEKTKKIQPAQPNGILKSLFSSNSLEKKVESIKKGKKDQAIDFNGESIMNIDLSFTTVFQMPIYFNTSIIKDSDFSNASFSNASFKNCILYNVNFENTVFDSVCFDGAVLINVNAKAAVFKNCSFQNISIYKSIFDRAMMSSAFFIAATLSKSSFQKTDLSGSSFMYSNLRAISFVNADLAQADFSGVQAQFSRFPAHARTALLKDENDLNARKYQLKQSDMPRFDTALLTRINMLIFGEFIHYGEMKFARQNRYSLITAFDIFKPRQADLFQIIPYLLHENIVLPGIKTDLNQRTPHGIFDYHPGPETMETIARYARGKKHIVDPQQDPSIEGLFTIGSIGSVAQANDSDIDYWVCIREDHIDKEDLALLEKKLRIIEKYAWEEFHIEVTFFLVDILKTRNNDFGDSTFESSGSAQAMLLKEEFYRTMIHVAGKLPLWSVLPTAISVNFYKNILEMVSTLPNLVRYIDLGDIHAISTGEFFGASIWQMFKSLKSPFKSVIKMALLEKYINELGEEPLLCNLYKDEWMNSGVNLKLAQNDAYYILLNNLLKYFKQSEDQESVALLLTCFFLKLGISNNSEIDTTVFGLRKILVEECLTNWGWSRDKMLKIGAYQTWPYKNIARLSYTLETYIVKKYKTLNKAFEKLNQGDSQISPEDRTVLGRKVYSELSRQPGKIEKVLLVSKSEILFNGLHLKFTQAPGQPGTWALINKDLRGADREETLITATTIEEIGAWLIVNKIYSDSCGVNLLPNPTPVAVDDIRKLFKSLYDYFGPVIKKPVSFDRLLKKRTITDLFVSVNFYAPRQQRRITGYTMIYMNTWGEMFFKSYASIKGLPEMEDVKNNIQQQLGIKTMTADTACYVRGLLKKIS